MEQGLAEWSTRGQASGGGEQGGQWIVAGERRLKVRGGILKNKEKHI